MLPHRASLQANLSATIVKLILLHHTSLAPSDRQSCSGILKCASFGFRAVEFLRGDFTLCPHLAGVCVDYVCSRPISHTYLKPSWLCRVPESGAEAKDCYRANAEANEERPRFKCHVHNCVLVVVLLPLIDQLIVCAELRAVNYKA